MSIKKWSRMVAKLKGRFLPKDYQIALHRQVQNLKQKGMTVREYIEEFYWVSLRAGYTEDTPEKTTRYVNGLRLEILDESSILSPKNIEEAYQSAMKAEEKIARNKMPGEDGEPAEEEDSLIAKGELLAVMKKAAVLKFPEQQKKVIAQEVVGHISEAGKWPR